MKDLIRYKGYYGSVHYDPDEPIFYGKVEFIKALISYEAIDAVGIKRAFEEAVDDYLEMCRQESIEPEQPFKGSLNIRTGHELHQKVALAALKEKISINKYICQTLAIACERDLANKHAS
jgi:predicted HicB family RNase H-like nuclease